MKPITRWLNRWYHADAQPWQFWLPQSGFIGGILLGCVMYGIVVTVKWAIFNITI